MAKEEENNKLYLTLIKLLFHPGSIATTALETVQRPNLRDILSGFHHLLWQVFALLTDFLYSNSMTKSLKLRQTFVMAQPHYQSFLNTKAI